ncbi:MAG: YqgE/AlgH family protein, partial [Candidatus Puniceispirillales bacterium]
MMKYALTGQLLIASPQMDDSRFSNSVILICEHDTNSAMGLVINQRTDDLDLDKLATQLDTIRPTRQTTKLAVVPTTRLAARL